MQIQLRTSLRFTILSFDTHKFDPTCIYLPKVNNRNKIRCDISSKLNRDNRGFMFLSLNKYNLIRKVEWTFLLLAGKSLLQECRQKSLARVFLKLE